MTDKPFSGEIEDAHIHDHPLTDEEIIDVFERSKVIVLLEKIAQSLEYIDTSLDRIESLVEFIKLRQ